MANDAQVLHMTSDRNVLRNVRLLGGQHTVYFGAKNCAQASRNPCLAGRTLVERSYIAGNIDFIYGDGTLFCDGCELHSTEHPVVNGAEGFVTAQGKHYPSQPSEFIFRNARLTADPGVQNVFLGQPWRDFSTVIFLNPQLGPHIGAAGFRERMSGGASRMESAYFRVYKPTGAAISAKNLTPAEASRYTLNDVLRGEDGWDPHAR
jgi:pectin methylesterase-like acyl-CoA thioesterase